MIIEKQKSPRVFMCKRCKKQTKATQLLKKSPKSKGFIFCKYCGKRLYELHRNYFESRTCLFCKNDFTPTNGHQLYCCIQHRDWYYLKRKGYILKDY